MKNKTLFRLITEKEFNAIKRYINSAITLKNKIEKRVCNVICNNMIQRGLKVIRVFELQKLGFNQHVPSVGPEMNICGTEYVSQMRGIELVRNSFICITHGDTQPKNIDDYESSPIYSLYDLTTEDILNIVLYLQAAFKFIDEKEIKQNDELELVIK